MHISMKLAELKPGDWVRIDDEGVNREGTVVRVSYEENEVNINNGIQEFWYSLDHVYGVPLDEGQLMRLGFERKETGAGVKYGKGAFRLQVPAADNFSRVEIWYREDRRQFDHPLMVHELQNLFLQMTKMHLEP